MSCTVAPPNARLNSFLFPDMDMETIVLVTEVPILAPMMIGTASFTGMTEKNKQ